MSRAIPARSHRMRANRSATGGFTMIEIVITLAIIILLIGISTAAMQSVWHSRDLEMPMAKLREFAKRARNAAIFEQRPFQVEITPTSVALYSLVGGAANALNRSAGDPPPRGLVSRYEWDGDVVMSVRRWNQQEFSEAVRHTWIFERSGLCEPITARATSEFGFIEMSFNALDAHVEDKVSEIR